MYFNNVNDLSELKVNYRKLVFLHHPDRGGDEEIMKKINNEYEKLFEQLKTEYNNSVDEDRQTSEMPEQVRDILSELVSIKDIEVEICGNWVWVSGNTKAYKDILKNLNFFWASKKKMWYWRADNFKSYNRGTKTIDEIRTKYGTTKVIGNKLIGA